MTIVEAKKKGQNDPKSTSGVAAGAYRGTGFVDVYRLNLV
jgi:hypothetical protein